MENAGGDVTLPRVGMAICHPVLVSLAHSQSSIANLLPDQPDGGASPGLDVPLPPGLLPALNLTDQRLEVDLCLHGRAVSLGGPTPGVHPTGVGARGQQGAQDEQVAVAAGEVQGGVAVDVGLGEGGLGAVGGVGQQDLHDGVVAVEAGLHDGVAAAEVLAQDGRRVVLAEAVHDLGMAGGRGEREGRLVAVVEGRRVGLVAELDEEAADGDVAERRGEVEVRVGVAREREVGVVEELRVRREDAPRQQRVVGVDGPAEADGRVDPGARSEESVGRVHFTYMVVVTGMVDGRKMLGRGWPWTRCNAGLRSLARRRLMAGLVGRGLPHRAVRAWEELPNA